jgi:hypothetical protein
MRPVRNIATAVAILAFAVVSASAQPIISAKSGIIASVEGKFLINKEEVQSSVTHFPEVKEGAVLSTEDGRVELMLPPGFMLRMGENGALKMLGTRLIDTRVELQAGSSIVEVDQQSQDYNVNLAVKDRIVNLSKVGVYRFDSDPARIKVFHGMATVQIGDQSVLVGTGRMLALTGDSPTVEKFDVEQTDALDNWSRRRAEAMALANVSGAKYGNNNPQQRSGGGSWSYNPYFDMYTYIPMNGTMCNPYYGLCYYSPMTAYNTFYRQPVYTAPAGFGGGGSGTPTYTPMSGTSTGTATSVSSAPMSSGSAPAASASSSTAAAASSASSGHGSASSGGHGK